MKIFFKLKKSVKRISIIFCFTFFQLPITSIQQCQKPDSRLDILLLHDQQNDMGNVPIDLSNDFWEGVDNWIKNIFKRTQETRFSIMGCGSFVSPPDDKDFKPKLYFDGNGVNENNLLAKVLQGEKDVRILVGHKGNCHACVNGVHRKKIFNTDYGERPDAKNVIFCK